MDICYFIHKTTFCGVEAQEYYSQKKKKFEFHGRYMAYLSSHSLQRVEMIGHDNNQNVFSFNHLRHPCCAQLFNMLAMGAGAGINKRHQGMKAEVTSGSVVPEANIQVVTAGSETELNPIAEMQRNPMPALLLLCPLCGPPQPKPNK